MKVPRHFYLGYDDLILALIISAFIGVAISFSDFYLFHFVLLIILTVGVYQLRENQFRLKLDFLAKKHIFSLFIILPWYMISLFWTPNLELGFKYIFYIFCGIVVVLSIVYYSSTINKINKVFSFLSTLIFAEIIIGLIESFTNFRMPISSYSSYAIFFGKDPVNFFEFDKILSYSSLRPPTGFRWNTNDFAICMIISLPFFLCYKKTWIKVFGILSITTVVLMTASRAVFLAMLIIYFFHLLFIKKRIGTLFFILIISFGILWGMSVFSDSDNPRINELANSLEALTLFLSGQLDIGGSVGWRRELMDNGLSAFYQSYGLGIGAGGSVANQEILGPVAGRFTSMHNFWIELLVEGGIIALTIFSFWILGITYNLFIITRTSKNDVIQYYSQSLFLSITAFIPAAIAASSTIYFFPMWIMFGFAISVILLSKN